MLKPKTVMQRWNKLCEELKPKSPGRRQAKEYAKLCGMKSIGEVRCAKDMDRRGITVFGFSIFNPPLLYF